MADFIVDLFSTLDGFGTGPIGYWGKEGPELVAERARALGDPGPDARVRRIAGLPDIDLELVDSRTFDGRVQQLLYIPRGPWSH